MNFKRLSFALGMAVPLFASHARANLSFNLIPDPGMPQVAIDGFNAAAGLWSAVLLDNIIINLQIGYSPLGTGVIGETSSSFVERTYSEVTGALATHATSAADFSSHASLQTGSGYNRLINHTSNNPNGPNSATPYVDTMDRVGLTTANARVLGLVPQDDSLDATIRFSTAFAFDFDQADGITPGQYDFVGAAAHEIGHVLGFVSGVDDIDSLGGVFPGDNFSSNLIDLFRYSALSIATGVGISDYTADARDKYFSVDGGETAIASFATGVTYGDGRQASHWRDNLGIGIMDPTAAAGELISISPTDRILFDVLGYTVPEPSVVALFGIGLLFLLARGVQRRHDIGTC